MEDFVSETVELNVVISLGMTVNRIVEKTHHVVFVLVEIARQCLVPTDTEVVVMANAESRFTYKHEPSIRFSVACAAVHCAGPLCNALNMDGDTAQLRIEASSNVGMVNGLVLDSRSPPVTHEVVPICSVDISSIVPSGDAAPPLPALSSEDGHFHSANTELKQALVCVILLATLEEQPSSSQSLVQVIKFRTTSVGCPTLRSVSVMKKCTA